MNPVSIEVPERNVVLDVPQRTVMIELIHVQNDESFLSDTQPYAEWRERD